MLRLQFTAVYLAGFCLLTGISGQTAENWSTCSVSCGGGVRARSIKCPTCPKGERVQMEICNTMGCESGSQPRAQWGPWSDWSPCTLMSGQNTAYRKRICQNAISGGTHTSCRGSSVEYTTCTAGGSKNLLATPIGPISENTIHKSTSSGDTQSVHLPLSKDEAMAHTDLLSRSIRSLLEELLYEDPILLGNLFTGAMAVVFSVTVMSRVNRILLQRKKRCGLLASKRHRL